LTVFFAGIVFYYRKEKKEKGEEQDKRIGLQIVEKNKITKNFNRKVEEGRGGKYVQTKNLFRFRGECPEL
jgi:hypothetical protein